MRRMLQCLIVVACALLSHPGLDRGDEGGFCGGDADRAIVPNRLIGSIGGGMSFPIRGVIQSASYPKRFGTELDLAGLLDSGSKELLSDQDLLARIFGDKSSHLSCERKFSSRKILQERMKDLTKFGFEGGLYRFEKHQTGKFHEKKKRDLEEPWSIDLKSRSEGVDKKVHKYLEIIHRASDQYGVDRSLIMAIIETESNFNPHAVSRSDAVGLMQVMQHSAGKDVFKMKGKLGQPSRKYLFNPVNNIDTGTAYLAMLQNIYLGSIVNPVSKRYAVISAYHSGVGSVLRIFSHSQEKAFRIINNLHPSEVYRALYTKHPSVESRSYLCKVNSLSNTISEDLLKPGES